VQFLSITFSIFRESSTVANVADPGAASPSTWMLAQTSCAACPGPRGPSPPPLHVHWAGHLCALPTQWATMRPVFANTTLVHARRGDVVHNPKPRNSNRVARVSIRLACSPWRLLALLSKCRRPPHPKIGTPALTATWQLIYLGMFKATQSWFCGSHRTSRWQSLPAQRNMEIRKYEIWKCKNVKKARIKCTWCLAIGFWPSEFISGTLVWQIQLGDLATTWGATFLKLIQGLQFSSSFRIFWMRAHFCFLLNDEKKLPKLMKMCQSNHRSA